MQFGIEPLLRAVSCSKARIMRVTWDGRSARWSLCALAEGPKTLLKYAAPSHALRLAAKRLGPF